MEAGKVAAFVVTAPLALLFVILIHHNFDPSKTNYVLQFLVNSRNKNQISQVEDFAKKAFSHVGLNYKDHVAIDQKLIRPAEVDTLLADYSKAKKNLNWEPKISFDDLVKNMVDHDLENINKI